MTSKYEFLPGRGSHYSGRIRSFVLRNQKSPKRKKRLEQDKDHDISQGQIVPNADARNLLQSQIDPFQTLAIRPNPVESIMLHHCKLAFCLVQSSADITTDLTDCLPNFGRHRREAFFPPRDIDWQLIRTDALTLSAAVQFAAMSLAMYSTSSPETLAFAEASRARTLKILRHRLELERKSPSDGLIHTLIGIVAVDTHIRYGLHHSPKLEDNVELHAYGLRAVLDSRYGWDMSRYHPVLAWELIW